MMIRDTSQQDKVIQSSKLAYIRKLAILAAVGTVAVIGWLTVDKWQNQSISINKDKVKLATVKRGNLFRDISTTGKIVAANAPVVYSTELGQITFNVKPGDSVDEGQLVAELSSPELISNLKQAKTNLQKLNSDVARAKLDARRKQLEQQQTMEMAKVELSAAEREFRRASTSIKQELISQIDFEKAQDDLAKAKLTYSHAKQETELSKDTLAFEIENKELSLTNQKLIVEELERQVNDLSIKSPVEGVVGNWLTEQKAKVAASQPLMTIVDLTAFEAELNVPEAYADELGIGMSVEISIGGEKLSGSLASISPEVRNNQVTTRVRMDSNQVTNLRQNQRLSARIILEEKKNVLMVKRGAFMQNNAGKLTYLVNDDIATRKNIAIGSTSISHVEITSGLKEGDMIVVSDLTSFEKQDTVLMR